MRYPSTVLIMLLNIAENDDDYNELKFINLLEN